MAEGPAANPFTPHDEAVLTAVLDEVIPPSPERGMPGAGELGLVRHLVAALEQHPALGPLLANGVAALEDLARRRHSGSFVDVARGERAALLRALEEKDAGFLPSLLFPTYIAYYQQPRVLEALGREPRPPHPKGYEMHPFEPALVEAVRRRGRMYRQV